MTLMNNTTRCSAEQKLNVSIVTMVRLHKAGEMVRRTALTLTQIAAATGFSGPAHMTTAFRQWIGFAPSELRTPSRYGLSAETSLLLP